MTYGTFYSIGIGPGDPELITLKAVRILNTSMHVFVPKARIGSGSLALSIARRHIHPQAQVHELVFPMSDDQTALSAQWDSHAETIAAILKTGQDACFLTLGDPSVYSTSIYLIRALRCHLEGVTIETVPGITSFSLAAALSDFALGWRKAPITIIPVEEDLTPIQNALQQPGTLILMKVGERLERVLEILEDSGKLDQSVFVARAGLEGERVVKDLRTLKHQERTTGYLAVILVNNS